MRRGKSLSVNSLLDDDALFFTVYFAFAHIIYKTRTVLCMYGISKRLKILLIPSCFGELCSFVHTQHLQK